MSSRPGPPRKLFGIEVPESVLRSGRAATEEWGTRSARLRLLPEFMVIGAKRSGTTSLYFHLLRHPGMLPMFPSARFLPKARDSKGVHFFDTNYGRGERWYRSHFPSVIRRSIAGMKLGYAPIVGEASPYYLYHPHAATRAGQLHPSAKLVALLRNPVERTYSHYREQRRNGVEKLSFAEAVAAEAQRTAGERDRLALDPAALSFPDEQQSYVAQSEYIHGVRRWLGHYPRSQLLVIPSEDYYRDPAATADRIYQFVGLPALGIEPAGVLNAAPKGDMEPTLRAELASHFAPLNGELEDLLGQRLGWT